jgi:hypothetical protein
MKRRLIGTVLFCLLISCIMGADTIAFDAGQPVANPGGMAGTIEGKGTYAVDNANNMGSLTFSADLDGSNPVQNTLVNANRNAPKWDATLTKLGAAKYNCFATLTTVTKKTGTVNFTHTYGGDPKNKVQVTVN